MRDRSHAVRLDSSANRSIIAMADLPASQSACMPPFERPRLSSVFWD